MRMDSAATKPTFIWFAIFNRINYQQTKTRTANVRTTAINYILRPQKPMCDKPAIDDLWIMRNLQNM